MQVTYKVCSDGGDGHGSGTEPCTELESVTVIGSRFRPD